MAKNNHAKFEIDRAILKKRAVLTRWPLNLEKPYFKVIYKPSCLGGGNVSLIVVGGAAESLYTSQAQVIIYLSLCFFLSLSFSLSLSRSYSLSLSLFPSFLSLSLSLSPSLSFLPFSLSLSLSLCETDQQSCRIFVHIARTGNNISLCFFLSLSFSLSLSLSLCTYFVFITGISFCLSISLSLSPFFKTVNLNHEKWTNFQCFQIYYLFIVPTYAQKL